jgi:hypothetical protein
MDSDLCVCCASLDEDGRQARKERRDELRREGYVYIQPKPSESCKPPNEYKEPTVNFSDDTVYRMSYMGADEDTAAMCRSRSLKRRDNLAPAGEVSNDTTQRHDYRGWPEAVPAKLAQPHDRDFFGGGRMSSLTTQKHDYRKKPMIPITRFTPDDKLRLSDKCMEDKSIATLSYQPHYNSKPAESCKPLRSYQVPSKEFHKNTVYTMSYIPLPATEGARRFRKGKYVKPTTPFDGDSVYSLSYYPPGEFVYVGDGASIEKGVLSDRQTCSNCGCKI